MKVISLRFGDNFAPKKTGTIIEHQKMISKNGFVWYGKFGNSISNNVIEQWKQEKTQKILLIKSATMERYWANVIDYQREVPSKTKIPSYYRDRADEIKCWFKIDSITVANKDVVSKCRLVSNGTPLGTASKVSMNPCMFVDYFEE